jgi:hypothetical protein
MGEKEAETGRGGGERFRRQNEGEWPGSPAGLRCPPSFHHPSQCVARRRRRGGPGLGDVAGDEEHVGDAVPPQRPKQGVERRVACAGAWAIVIARAKGVGGMRAALVGESASTLVSSHCSNLLTQPWQRPEASGLTNLGAASSCPTGQCPAAKITYLLSKSKD